jgi:hypothetical protein
MLLRVTKTSSAGKGDAPYEGLEIWTNTSQIDPTSSQKVMVIDIEPKASGVNVS